MNEIVSMPALDAVVGAAWIVGLTAFLIARAMFAWLKYRHAARFAQQAARLAEAVHPEPEIAQVLTFPVARREGEPQSHSVEA